jgi:hypothetical protein
LIKNNLRSVIKPLIVYVLALSALFIAIWLLLGIVMPELKSSLSNALSLAIGFEIPEDIVNGSSLTGMTLLVIIAVSALSVLLLLVHVLFEATITAKVLNPNIDIYTSKRGCLSDKWDQEKNHILVRMINFHTGDLVDVSIKAVITVHEDIEANGERTEFLCYFSVPYKVIDPASVLVLKERTPWTIAIPSDIVLSNSISSGYEMNVGEPIKQAVLPNNKLFSAKRDLEILIKGTDPRTTSSFSIHKTIELDEQIGDEYRLLLHKGSFKSLDMWVKSKDEVEQYI